MVRLLSGDMSARIDEDLMGEEFGFSVDQLMELAGLAVARVCYRQHPPVGENKKVLVLVGPGSKVPSLVSKISGLIPRDRFLDNGGDGLVAARHLFHYGYEPVVLYPKQPNRPLFQV